MVKKSTEKCENGHIEVSLLYHGVRRLVLPKYCFPRKNLENSAEKWANPEKIGQSLRKKKF